MSYVSVDIEIDDIISNMGRFDRKVFFQHMQKSGYISKLCVITNEGEVKCTDNVEKKAVSQSNDQFNNALEKLFNNGWKLTKEEEEYVINLSKRFI